MRPIVPSETQESQSVGPGGQRDEKSPDRDPRPEFLTLGCPVGSLKRLLL